jgi:hypothetical protein
MFTVAYDEKTGLIECGCEGFLALAEIREYGVRAADAAKRCRARFGFVRMFVHSFDSTIQTAEVMEEANKTNWEMSDPRDRMAILVSTALARLQALRYYRSPQVGIFLSREEAIDWLNGEAATRAA